MNLLTYIEEYGANHAIGKKAVRIGQDNHAIQIGDIKIIKQCDTYDVSFRDTRSNHAPKYFEIILTTPSIWELT